MLLDEDESNITDDVKEKTFFEHAATGAAYLLYWLDEWNSSWCEMEKYLVLLAVVFIVE